jgi:hypothetical protein
VNLSTVSASFPNSAVALDEQITSKVIQLVGTVRPDLEVLLWVGVYATSTAEEVDRLGALIDPDDAVLLMCVMRSVYWSYGLHLCDWAGGLPVPD